MTSVVYETEYLSILSFIYIMLFYLSSGHCHVWTGQFTQGLIWGDFDRCWLRSYVRPLWAVSITAVPDNVRCRAPIRRTRLWTLPAPLPFYTSQRPRHSASTAVRLALKWSRWEKFRSWLEWLWTEKLTATNFCEVRMRKMRIIARSLLSRLKPPLPSVEINMFVVGGYNGGLIY